MVNESVLERGHDLLWLQTSCRFCGLLISIACMLGAIQAQSGYEPTPGDTPLVVTGVSDAMAYSAGQSLRINGTVKAPGGAIALGGDVIVQGVVEGDVAAIGGSVIQLEGARIGGDVMVVGGTYRHVDPVPNRNPAAVTIMYAGYEQELRNMMRNPKDLLAPHWSASYIGFRVLAILFWFIVSLALTAAMPGTISRGIARLQLRLGRVAIIGVVGSLLIGPGVIFGLQYLPYMIAVVVGLLASLLILVAWLFGRVIIYAATGRWLQRKYLKLAKNSESVALLLGTIFWIALSSLPYIWPVVVAVVLVTSLGLALTARYRVGWKRQEL
ncbi:MAG TPA: hypothetical protein DHU55_19555 [Blastocatellia bacterium]|jgi:hypothetical protein|nr:hypothetical protein [Blastocatellia bacterium]HAF22768.1 hypothetical protein [Blastocatellia bacterium]HCX31941.1 hypothetical protein [Blastocatellia bacterium]